MHTYTELASYFSYDEQLRFNSILDFWLKFYYYLIVWVKNENSFIYTWVRATGQGKHLSFWFQNQAFYLTD